MMNMTPQQIDAVNRLESHGWREAHADDDTVYFCKRGQRRYQTMQCEVGPDGIIQGHELATTLNSARLVG